MINSETKLYCLIGNPVSKSLSPEIHNLSFKLNNINARYLVFNIDNDKLKETINGIKALKIEGFNVTIPFKESIIDYLDELDDNAKMIGAVNTVKNIDGKLIGYNTDSLGFLHTLEENFKNFNELKVAVIGAGGAGRAVSFSLANKNIKELLIINRKVDRAKILSEDIIKYHPDVKISHKNLNESEKIINQYDLIVNCTSVGMYPEIDKCPINPVFFRENTFVYDIIYKPEVTNLLYKSENEGLKTKNGLDMLLLQALYSEVIWMNQESEILDKKEMIKKDFVKISRK